MSDGCWHCRSYWSVIDWEEIQREKCQNLIQRQSQSFYTSTFVIVTFKNFDDMNECSNFDSFVVIYYWTWCDDRVLHDVPQTVRFAIAGFLCNFGFLGGFNLAVNHLDKYYAASTIYSIYYVFFIPVGHAINSLIVFGWPKPYLPSLLSNAPIGLTAMMLGTFFTGTYNTTKYTCYSYDSSKLPSIYLLSYFTVIRFYRF